MDMWEINAAGRKQFKYGQDDFELAAETAESCTFFVGDDEEEFVCDDERSCYNCRYRRWTAESFECMKL